MAKFIANNNESTSTKLSLFLATKSLYPRMSFDIVIPSNTSTHERIHKQNVLNIFGNIETIWEFAQKALAVAQKSHSKQIDEHHKNITYTIKDKVWLSTRNITTNRL